MHNFVIENINLLHLVGGCQKIFLTERQALVMPAVMIHMFEMHSDSVALGVKFIDRGHLLTNARGFLHERKDEELFSSCYPAFPMLALNELMVHLWLVSTIKLLHFVEINKNRKKNNFIAPETRYRRKN